MPELAEVEYYRKQWDAGLGARVGRGATARAEANLSRLDPREIRRRLTGSRLAALDRARQTDALRIFAAGAGSEFISG